MWGLLGRRVRPAVAKWAPANPSHPAGSSRGTDGACAKQTLARDDRTMKQSDLQQPDNPCDDGDFARFIRQLEEAIAERELADPRPEPPPPDEPWFDKPGTLIAAEKEMLAWELLERLQLPLCGGPEKCGRDRCRRARRCSELDEIRPMTEAARAKLARERAKWRPSEQPAEPPRKARRRTRS